jgi:hypothetical protein
VKGRWFSALLVLVLPVLILLANANAFPYEGGSQFTDLAVTFYPHALHVQRSLQGGEIPFWSDSILSGFPFAANPQSGLWYPPGWPAFFLPLPLGFNLLMALHLVWGGLGLFTFLRRRGLSLPAALLGGLAFTAMPKLFAHVAAGHLTLIYAVCWTPWLLAAETAPRRSLLAGAVLGLILAANPVWVIPAGLIWLAYRLYHRRFETSGQPSDSEPLTRFGLRTLAQPLIALLVAAPVWLLLLELVGRSTRQAMTPADTLTLSLQPGRLMGLLVPDFPVYAEYALYMGALPLLMIVYAWSVPRVRARTGFWLMTLLVSLLLAFGSYLPGMDALASLPGFSLMRVPTRWLFLAGLSGAIILAEGVDYLYRGGDLVKPDPVFWMTPLAVFPSLILAGLAYLGEPLPPQFIWAAVLLPVCLLLVILRQRTRLPAAIWVSLALVALAVDLCGVDWQGLTFRSAEEVLGEQEEIAQYLSLVGGPYRTYSPSYSLPQQTAAYYHLRLADGVEPLQLESYVRYFAQASNIPYTRYSVTLPPEPMTAAEAEPNRSEPDAARLGWLNIGYLVSAYDLRSEGLESIRTGESTRLYRNRLAQPRAWLQPDPTFPSAEVEPAFVTGTVNRRMVQATGPGFLVLSQAAYPGWHASLDGQPLPVTTIGDLFLAVELPAGEHLVEFQFWPTLLTPALIASVAGWGILIVTLSLEWRRRRHAA